MNNTHSALFVVDLSLDRCRQLILGLFIALILSCISPDTIDVDLDDSIHYNIMVGKSKVHWGGLSNSLSMDRHRYGTDWLQMEGFGMDKMPDEVCKEHDRVQGT